MKYKSISARCLWEELDVNQRDRRAQGEHANKKIQFTFKEDEKAGKGNIETN